MDVLGDLFARDRRSDDLAVRTDSRSGSYSYEKFVTNAWKAGNLLRHYGVREGATVAVASRDAGGAVSPPALLAFFGSALLGAQVRFDPASPAGAKALVVPADRLDAFDPDPGTKVLAYGGPADDPAVANFERETWSENPTAPPDAVSPDTAVLATDDGEFSHERVLSAAESVAAEFDLHTDDEVSLRAPLADPGAVAAGVVAPLLAGGTVLLDGSTTGTIGVGDGELPEERAVRPGTVL